MNDEAKKPRPHTRPMVDGVNWRKLVGLHGVTRAGELIGYSSGGGSQLNHESKKGQVPVTVELASQHLLSLISKEEAETDKLLIIKVTPSQHKVIRPVLEALGIRIAFVNDQ